MAKIKLLGGDALTASDSLKAASGLWRERHPGTFHGMFSKSSGDPATDYVSDFHRADYSGSREIADFSAMFSGCEFMVRAPLFDTGNGVDFRDMFSGCLKLKYVPAYDLSKAENLERIVDGCGELVEFACVNIGASLDLSSCRKMDAKALRAVIGNLVPAHGKGKVLRLGPTNIAKLRPDDISLANEKGWTLC